jgi:DUF971 family protein
LAQSSIAALAVAEKAVNCRHNPNDRSMSVSDTWPTEIRLKKDRRGIAITFANGVAFDLPAELLRVMSPSAEVQGHSPDQRKTIGGKIDVEIIKVEPVGNYAVRLTFDDMHDTGIFSWDYFFKLGTEQDQLWSDYLGELEKKGLTRERR